MSRYAKYKKESRRSFNLGDLFRLRQFTRKQWLLLSIYIASFALICVLVGLFSVILVFAYFSRALPNPNVLLERSDELSTRYYDRNDQLIFEQFGEKNRTLIKISEINPDVVKATLAAEDAEFYLHKGFSFRGIARALKNTLTGEGLQGGSTLTQQVIKNTLLTQERTATRKIKELILSLQLENRYTKEEIIQLYLNETPYGGQNYGIYSASKAYFNKDPKDLTLSESAYLAGLPQRPSYYSQFGTNPESGIERRNYVLQLMREKGWTGADGKRYYINQEDYDKARSEELKFDTAKVPLLAPHFVFYTKQYLSDILGAELVENGGLRIKTSLDQDIHKLAEETIFNEVEKSKSTLNFWNGAMVVLDPKTGQILTMIGSKGYNLDPEPEGCTSGIAGENGCKFDPYVNVATSLRQPGSSIKPVTYATMLSKGYSAAFPFMDVPTKFDGSAPGVPYVPVNYDGLYRGPVSLRRSLASSLNVPAVKALKIVGIDAMITQAEKMGITSFTDRQRYGLAITLGGVEAKLLDLTGAYSVFAAKGDFHRPVPIIEVQNARGDVIYRPTEPVTKAVGEDVAFIISDILSDDGARAEAFGTGSLLSIPGHQVAVKTGTTDEKRDNYAVGFTPSVVAGVWVGNNNNDAMNPYVASGISGASPIWNTFMKTYLKDKTAEKFEAPKNVKKIAVDKLTGMLPYEGNEQRSEWFIENSQPTARSSWYEKLEICKIDGRIANQGCKDAGETEVKDFIRIRAERDEWQYSVDEWVKKAKGGDSKYYPPTMVSQLKFDGDEVANKDEVAVGIVDFEDNSKVPLDFRLKVETSSYNEIDKINFYMDGSKIAEDQSEPFGYTFSLRASQIGKHEFEVSATDKKGNKGKKKIILEVVGYSN
jgi:membrane peptidoglycan carboxypeptidase